MLLTVRPIAHDHRMRQVTSIINFSTTNGQYQNMFTQRKKNTYGSINIYYTIPIAMSYLQTITV